MTRKTRKDFFEHTAAFSGTLFGSYMPGAPQEAAATPGIFPERQCLSKNTNDKRILVAYASEYGSTGDVAVTIGKTLCKQGFNVDILQIKNVKDISGYDAFVIGSPIQYDDWKNEAKKFIKTYGSRLQNFPVAYFFTCLTLSKRKRKNLDEAEKYADKISKTSACVNAIDVGKFTGVLDYKKIPLFTSLVARFIFFFLDITEGDYRDWKTIEAWARKVGTKI